MRIKELRELRGISQRALASAMGVSQPAVVNWESGKSMPSADKIPMMADVLGCTADELLGRKSASA